MKPRHFITVADLTAQQTLDLFDEAAAIKGRLRRGVTERCLAGKTLALIFEKASNRTRVSFEVGMIQLGGQAIYLASDTIRLGVRESIPDVARVVSSYVDGVVLRTYAHRSVAQFARYSRVPAINGLSDYNHPCQALADLFTIREKLGRLEKVKVAFVGDGNNVARSLAWACWRMGLRFVIAAPKGHGLSDKFVRSVRKSGRSRTGSITQRRDPSRAVKGADIIYTDVWTSMGQEAQAQQRRAAFKGYQVDAKLLKAAGRGALVMHCLPAHRGEEISGEVIDGGRSIVFEQAENRMHAQKALLKMLLAG